MSTSAIPQLPQPTIMNSGAAIEAPIRPIQFCTGASVADIHDGSSGV